MRHPRFTPAKQIGNVQSIPCPTMDNGPLHRRSIRVRLVDLPGALHEAVAGNEFGSSLIAIAESIRDPGDVQRAEFALAAVDPWQSLGIGTLLTRHVARIAALRGIRFW